MHSTPIQRLAHFLAAALVVCVAAHAGDPLVDLSGAVVVVRRDAPAVEQTAAEVLVEEVKKRTGLKWPVRQDWPSGGPAVGLVSGGRNRLAGRGVALQRLPEQADAYALAVERQGDGGVTVWVAGADARGALYGVGGLLRQLRWGQGEAALPAGLNVLTAPAYPLRGHQLGYRGLANSYDAWTPAQYDQYVRELTFFGVNAIENIPFQSTENDLMPVPRDEMNREMSRICQRYGIEYWVWSPATFDLKDEAARAEHLDRHEAFFAECARLDAVFFPGGDPGHNHPEEVMPFLGELAGRLHKSHPEAKIWISLQGFDADRIDYFYEWVEGHEPDWLGGEVSGPSSPPIPASRHRLPRAYGLRHYPDITHAVRCQYPTLWWDPAFAFTLGREPVNPQPYYYALIHNALAPYTSGFITYSDGIHDDVNKTIWSARGWDPEADVRETLTEYARVFFGPEVAEGAADGIIALERNWDGALAQNGGVDAAFTLWRGMTEGHPDLLDNWRWQMCLMRAYYDAYTRHRLLYETALEEEANALLLEAPELGADAAMAAALEVLERADTQRTHPGWRRRVIELCAALFDSIGLQTSVPIYGGENPERGCVLDFLDIPLNNRWWLEDEFAKVRKMPSEQDKLARLREIATWEHPGPGSFYDDVGNVAKSDHLVRSRVLTLGTDPSEIRNPDCMWWDSGYTRARRSWISYMDWPHAVRYRGVDPAASYVIRATGNGDCLLNIDGARAEPTRYNKETGGIKEWPVPPEAAADGVIELTFDRPHEPNVNWRHASRLNEIWLIRE